jgi:hypothetical protein
MLRRTALARQAAATASAAGSAAGGASPLSSLKLKTVKDYMAMPEAELRRMIATRDEQISELKALNEKSHTSVEYVHRKQLLDWEEHSLHFAQAAGGMTSDSMSNCREKCKEIRNKNDTEERDRNIVLSFLLIATLAYWWWLSRHYFERPDAPRPRQQSAINSMGPSLLGMFGTGKTWSPKHVDTAWQAERAIKQRERENARFPKLSEEDDVPKSS